MKIAESNHKTRKAPKLGVMELLINLILTDTDSRFQSTGARADIMPFYLLILEYSTPERKKQDVKLET